MTKYLSLLLFIGLSWGQPPIDTLWTKNNFTNYLCKDMVLCNDGGYLIITGSFPNGEVIKTDNLGNVVFNYTLNMEGTKGFQTPENDYLIAGNGSEGNLNIIKLNNNGELIWYESLETPSFFRISSITNHNNGYLISGNVQDGTTYTVGYIVKINSNGVKDYEIYNEDYMLYDFIFSVDDVSGAFGVIGEKFVDGYYTDISLSYYIDGQFNNEHLYDFSENDWPTNTIRTYNNEFVFFFNTLSTRFLARSNGDLQVEFGMDADGYKLFTQSSDSAFIVLTGNSLKKTNFSNDVQWEYEIPFEFYNPISLFENFEGNFILINTGGELISIGLSRPIIDEINSQQTNEDEPIIVNVSANGYSSLTYFAESDTSAMPVYIDGTSIAIGLEANWNGIGTITVTVIDENQLSDTTDFTITVLPVNDAPQDFDLVFPTILDTIQINTDTDETVVFHWEECVDVDSDVDYLTTVTLDYFGNVFTQEYGSDTSSVSITGYLFAVLMTNQNLDRWTLQYSVKASDEEYEVAKEGEFVFQNTSLSVDGNITPLTFNLYQNYPNPFNPITTLKYDLPEDFFVDVTIYDMLGNVVNNLVNKNQNSGSKLVQWDATNYQGEPVSAGVYLYRIQAGDFNQTKKMILLK